MPTKSAPKTTTWVSFAYAKRLARQHAIKSPTEWVTFVKNRKSARPLPSKPQEVYAQDWTSWAEFLGSASRVGRAEEFWPFEKARKYVRGLSLSTKSEFQLFARSNRCPPEIPVAPHYVYLTSGWQGYADFLGAPVRGAAATKRYWTYEQARDYVQTLGFATTSQWSSWSRSDRRPPEIPVAPHLAYRGKGWSTWADFLGAPYQKASQLYGLRRSLKLLGYAKAREHVAQLGFETAQDFRIWARSGQRPENIPVHPEVTYAGKKWKGWSHFLGLGKVRRGVGLHSTRDVLSYKAARTVVKPLNLKEATDYHALLKQGQLPNGLPAKPDEHYANDGWTSWGAFLGSRTKEDAAPSKLKVVPGGFLQFADARKFARGLKFTTPSSWFRYASSAMRPVYIPKEPWKTYFQEGYTSLEDFLGLATARPQAEAASA